ncbi:hypothetical protein [Mycolicibacterium sp. XJ1819]
MPELEATDVEQYTGGRLDRDDNETAALLARGVAAARRFCGWHVTPQRVGDVQTLDGRGGPLLILPTLALAELTEVTEDGTAVDVTDLHVSARGLVSKKSGAHWSCNLGAITVKMTHGFDAAPDFQAAVLSWIDRMSLAPTGGRARVIGPFQYSDEAMAAGTTFSASERALLDLYRLEPRP